MEIILDRKFPRETYSIGKFFIDGQPICDTIEDRDRGLHDSMDEARIRDVKVFGETAIPKGRYRVSLTVSEKFREKKWAQATGGVVPLIENVKGFSGIRIHPSNTAEELLGCIAPGYNTTVGRVNNSVMAYSRIMEKLLPAWEAGEPIYITII